MYGTFTPFCYFILKLRKNKSSKYVHVKSMKGSILIDSLGIVIRYDFELKAL